MLDDKNKKMLWLFTTLIILFSIIIYSIGIDQNSIEVGTDPGNLNKTTTAPTTTTPLQPEKTTTTSPQPEEQITTLSQSNEQEQEEQTQEKVETQGKEQEQEQVEFAVYLDKGKISECGMTCREIPATLKNTGGDTAHNVEVTVRFYCDGDRIDINGEEYLSLDLGSLEPGESETRTKEIDVGFGGGLCIQNNGARIVFTVASDEKTMTLEETYNP